MLKFSLPFFCLFSFLAFNSAWSQGGPTHAFQWRFQTKNNGDMRGFDNLALPDRGGLMAGIVEADSGTAVFYPYVFRYDCRGQVLWAKVFDQFTEGANNVDARVLPLPDGDFVLIANVGFFFTTPFNDIFAARMDADGNTVWAHRIGGGTLDSDVAQDAILTSDGNIVIAGKTSSHGSDAGSAYYLDQYFLKLNASDGQILWSRTAGNAGAVDRAYAIVETANQDLVAAGSYLQGGTFQANLLRMTKNGTVMWNKTFGDATAPHGNHAYGLIQTSDGGFLLTGASTNAKTNFQDYPDFLAIKTNPNGVAEWTRVYSGGGPDLFENASNAFQKPNGDILIACATASFPTQGFVPNKMTLLTISKTGQLLNNIAFNSGGSFYPRITKDPFENSLHVVGFTNWSGYGGNGNRFDPLLINLDQNLDLEISANCSSKDYTNLCSTFNPAFEIGDAPFAVGTGGAFASNVITSSDFEILTNVICELNPYFTCPTVSVLETIENQEFTISPNPAKHGEPVKIRWNAEAKIGSLSVWDAFGKKVLETKPLALANSLEFNALRPGVYFVEVDFSDKKLGKKMVVVE